MVPGLRSNSSPATSWLCDPGGVPSLLQDLFISVCVMRKDRIHFTEAFEGQMMVGAHVLGVSRGTGRQGVHRSLMQVRQSPTKSVGRS